MWSSVVSTEILFLFTLSPSLKEAPGATGNVLDSTAPSVRRGKEREAPKPKKPTQLRKVTHVERVCTMYLYTISCVFGFAILVSHCVVEHVHFTCMCSTLMRMLTSS